MSLSLIGSSKPDENAILSVPSDRGGTTGDLELASMTVITTFSLVHDSTLPVRRSDLFKSCYYNHHNNEDTFWIRNSKLNIVLMWAQVSHKFLNPFNIYYTLNIYHVCGRACDRQTINARLCHIPFHYDWVPLLTFLHFSCCHSQHAKSLMTVDITQTWLSTQLICGLFGTDLRNRRPT